MISMSKRLGMLAEELDRGWTPNASTAVRQAACEIDHLTEIIRDLIAEPRVSRDLISKKVPRTALMSATFTKGQVLAAIEATKREE